MNSCRTRSSVAARNAALLAVCSELDLALDDVLAYFNVDIPRSLITRRRISLPILLDIRTHLVAVALTGEAPFSVSPKMRAVLAEEFRPLPG